MHNWT